MSSAPFLVPSLPRIRKNSSIFCSNTRPIRFTSRTATGDSFARAARFLEADIQLAREVQDYSTKLPLLDSSGNVIGICGINKDWTQRQGLVETDPAAEIKSMRVAHRRQCSEGRSALIGDSSHPVFMLSVNLEKVPRHDEQKYPMLPPKAGDEFAEGE
jgi:hypothetical protein